MQPNGLDRIAITHFTTQAAAARILDGWRHEVLDQSQGSDDFGIKELSLRLYSRYGMNDPNEHLHEPRRAVKGLVPNIVAYSVESRREMSNGITSKT